MNHTVNDDTLQEWRRTAEQWADADWDNANHIIARRSMNNDW